MCLTYWLCEKADAGGGCARRLLLVNNRDEFYERPTGPIHWHCADAGCATPKYLCADDLRGGGTWLAAREDGRVGVLTNLWTPNRNANAETRGQMVVSFMRSHNTLRDFVAALLPTIKKYNGFQLLLIDEHGNGAMVSNGLADAVTDLQSGQCYGVGNTPFDDPPQKLRHGLALFSSAVQNHNGDLDRLNADLTSIMSDTEMHWPDEAMRRYKPELTAEELSKLSSRAIVAGGPNGSFGTTRRTVVSIGADDACCVTQTSIDSKGCEIGEEKFQWKAVSVT